MADVTGARGATPALDNSRHGAHPHENPAAYRPMPGSPRLRRGLVLSVGGEGSPADGVRDAGAADGRATHNVCGT